MGYRFERLITSLFVLLLSVGPALTTADAPVAVGSVIRLRYVTVLVRDYDEALTWYTQRLGLKKVEDRPFGPGRRWLVVAPEGQSGFGIVLDVPHSDAIKADRIGKETDWVFDAANCDQFFEQAQQRGVHFLQPPKQQPWGTVQAIFEDPCGNRYVAESMHQSSASAKSPP